MKTFYLLILFITCSAEVSKATFKVTIGALMDSPKNVRAFNEAVESPPEQITIDKMTLKFEAIGRVRIH